MTAMELNAELFRELSIIANDEGLMKKAVKYLKKLSAKKQTMDETEYIMSSPKMVEILREGEKEIELKRRRIANAIVQKNKELEEIKITLETSRKHLEGCKKKEKKIH